MERRVLRFSANWRIQHMLLVVSVTLLILSGFALKYYDTWLGKILIFLEGGFEARGMLHRLSAVLLFVTILYHLIYITLTKEGRGEFKALLFNRKDFSDFIESVKFDLGKNEKLPAYGRYSYKEKLQYWAFVVFLGIMTLSGIVLWFHNFFFGLLPKWVIDLSFAFHSFTATLIILFLVLWHLYIVHLSPENFPMNKSFWDGYVSEEWLKKNHRLEYEELKEKGIVK